MVVDLGRKISSWGKGWDDDLPEELWNSIAVLVIPPCDMIDAMLYSALQRLNNAVHPAVPVTIASLYEKQNLRLRTIFWGFDPPRKFLGCKIYQAHRSTILKYSRSIFDPFAQITSSNVTKNAQIIGCKVLILI